MNQKERITFLAEENTKRNTLRSLRERFSHSLGGEVSEQMFFTYDAGQRPIFLGVSSMPRPDDVRVFLRYHLPEDFVEKNHRIIEAFGERIGEEAVLLETKDGSFPWLKVEAGVFSRLLEWSREQESWWRLWFCVCDLKVENGFCLREGTNYGGDPEIEGQWTIEVFGEKWVTIAEAIFEF